MKILVTGASGFVGQHIIKEMSKVNASVVCIRGKTSDKIKDKQSDGFLNLDLTKIDDVKKINFKDIDSVVHLAGLASVGPSFTNPMLYISSNIGMQVNLFEEAMRQRVRPKFLIISSASVYDQKSKMPLSEKSQISATSPYAISKVGQEMTAFYYMRMGFECIIARPFNHIGTGQSLGFILPDLIRQAIKVKDGSIDLIKVGNLKAKRDYTDVRDIARAYRLLIEKGMPGEIYNVCSGKAYSGEELLDIILGTINIKPRIIKDPSLFRPIDTPTLFGNHDKITSHVGWKPEIPLERTIKDILENY